MILCLDLLSIHDCYLSALIRPPSSPNRRVASNGAADSRFKRDSREIEIDCSTWNVRAHGEEDRRKAVGFQIQVVRSEIGGKEREGERTG